MFVINMHRENQTVPLLLYHSSAQRGNVSRRHKFNFYFVPNKLYLMLFINYLLLHYNFEQYLTRHRGVDIRHRKILPTIFVSKINLNNYDNTVTLYSTKYQT